MLLALLFAAACRTEPLAASDGGQQSSLDLATIDHGWFVIGPGTMHDVACAACHTTPGDDSLFSCTAGGCHPQAEADGQHTTVAGYSYGATKCYECHSSQ